MNNIKLSDKNGDPLYKCINGNPFVLPNKDSFNWSKPLVYTVEGVNVLLSYAVYNSEEYLIEWRGRINPKTGEPYETTSIYFAIKKEGLETPKGVLKYGRY